MTTVSDGSPDTFPTEQQLRQRIAELERRLADYERAPPNHLEAVLNAIAIPIFYKDPQGVYLGCNSAFAAYLGLPREQIVGKSVYDLSPPDLAEVYHAADMALLRERAVQIYESQVLSAEGARRDVVFTKTVFDSPDGSVGGLVGTIQDVTESRRLAEERDRFFGLALDMLCIVNFEGRFERLNPAWQMVLGYSAEELTGKLFLNFVHPDDREATMAATAEVFSGKNVTRFENRYRCKDGSYRWIEWQSAAVPEQRQVYAAARDITERKQTEVLLRESEHRLTQFLNALPVGVFVIDAAGRPFYANQTAQHILGRGIVPMAGKDELAEVYNAYLVGTDQLYPTERLPIVRALHGEHVTIADIEVRQPNRRVVLEVSGAPIRNADDTVLYAMIAFADITERKLAQEALELRASQEALIQAQAAALAELSTPLLAISDRVVVMPLIGAIDSYRAQQVVESLLTGVAERRATTAIIDITGVAVVDTQVADTLLRAAQAVRLLGAEAVLTGIRPEIAQTLVGLGVDLSGIITRGTLQSGIAHAIRRR